MDSKILLCRSLGLSLAMAVGGVVHAQVPADIEAQLRKIGQIVDPPCTAKLYRPLMPANDINSNVTPLYPGITIARDVSFGPNPKDVVDIFSADKGPANRTVLMYIPGGAGNKIEQQNRESNAFYDNIGRWGTKNGMVVVLMQRHPGRNWDDPAKDVSAMIQWVEANIAKYKGDPERMFIWAQSAGNGPLGTYIGRPEVWGLKGVGVNPLAAMGAACGEGGDNAKPGLIAGPSRADPRPPAGRGFGGFQPPDPATQLARSTLPEFKKTKVKLLFATAELDPGIDGKMSPFFQTLHDELCKEGPDHCPTMLFEKGESHMSEVFSIDTADKTVSGPILAWIKKVK
jgi:hypothetical protein